ncbi:MAG: GNAT family N-acetyltransferase [Cyanobacteria bacterium P01_A01_bin.105]
MSFTTHRLILRDWHPLADAQPAFDIYGDPAVTRWIGSGVADTSRYETQARLQGYCRRSADPAHPLANIWAVVEKDIDRIIGTVLLVPLLGVDGEPTAEMEIGWHFRRASWGYGYATEAAQSVVRYALPHLPAIYAVALPDNARSIKVMKRLGMNDLGLTHRYYGGRELALFGLTASGP